MVFRGFPGEGAGTDFALQPDVCTRRLGQTILIFLPLIICGARLHAGAVGSPTGVTQEVSRCLTMVRVAAARRNGQHAASGVERPRPRHAGRKI